MANALLLQMTLSSAFVQSQVTILRAVYYHYQ